MNQASTVSAAVVERFDVNKDGRFSETELGNMVFAMGHYLSPAELTAAFAKLDADGSGYVEKEEFLSWWNADARFSHLRLDEAKEARVQQFAAFFLDYDTDGTGFLEAGPEFEKFYTTLKGAGYRLPAGGVAEALAHLDSNGDGQVSFNEFLRYLIDDELL